MPENGTREREPQLEDGDRLRFEPGLSTARSQLSDAPGEYREDSIPDESVILQDKSVNRRQGNEVGQEVRLDSAGAETEGASGAPKELEETAAPRVRSQNGDISSCDTNVVRRRHTDKRPGTAFPKLLNEVVPRKVAAGSGPSEDGKSTSMYNVVNLAMYADKLKQRKRTYRNCAVQAVRSTASKRCQVRASVHGKLL